MNKTGTPNDPLSILTLSVFEINGLLLRSGENVTRPLGQTSARWQVLGRAGYKPQTVSQMARDIGNSRQSVQRIADALAAENLISYIPNPSDKRADLVMLTPQGKEILDAIYKRDQEWSKQLREKLDSDQIEQVAHSLRHISDTLRTFLENSSTQGGQNSEDN